MEYDSIEIKAMASSREVEGLKCAFEGMTKAMVAAASSFEGFRLAEIAWRERWIHESSWPEFIKEGLIMWWESAHDHAIEIEAESSFTWEETRGKPE